MPLTHPSSQGLLWSMVRSDAARLPEDIVEILQTAFGCLDFKAKIRASGQGHSRTQDFSQFASAIIGIERRYDRACWPHLRDFGTDEFALFQVGLSAD